MKKPLAPQIVKDAPCQEVVIRDNIDVMGTLPILKHTEKDAGRIIGGGNTFVSGKYFRGGTHVSFNRMHFRGKDWSSISFGSGNHLESVAYVEHRGETIPMTINIGTPPAVGLIAAAGFLHVLVPEGTDELGYAGGLQGAPVEIVKAKTVEAYSIAQSEWVLEGYVDTTQRVWESEEAEKLGKSGITPFFPEWTGYLGRAYRLLKFQVTAITHRKDSPIFFTPLADSFETDIAGAPFREACFYELADRVRPGLVVDVNILPGVAGWGGHIIFQVKKRRRSDEGYQRGILSSALSAYQGLRLAVIVDEDVDIYSADDIMWALTTRVNPGADMIRSTGGGMGQALMPMERSGTSQTREAEIRFEGGMGIDATVPFDAKWNFERSKYPVDRIDLKDWFSEEEIAKARASQSEYAKILGSMT
jgi:4-hydroxy-3-polyprenylbenzoate decarboxylase